MEAKPDRDAVLAAFDARAAGAYSRCAPQIVDGVVICRECSLPMRPDGVISSTLVGYGDASCSLHQQHDDNCLVQGYACPNQHCVFVSIRRACPCGWRGKESCFCHVGAKVNEWPK